MFEHKFMTFRGQLNDAEPRINELGADGWALISAYATPDATSTIVTHHFCLRREITINLEQGQLAFCFPRGAHFVLAYRLDLWKQDQPAAVSQADAVAKLEHLADVGGVGLTPHAVAVERALEAVAKVNLAFDEMQANGGLNALNTAFKAARAANPALRYNDYLHARKAEMLDKIAGE